MVAVDADDIVTCFLQKQAGTQVGVLPMTSLWMGDAAAVVVDGLTAAEVGARLTTRGWYKSRTWCVGGFEASGVTGPQGRSCSQPNRSGKAVDLVRWCAIEPEAAGAVGTEVAEGAETADDWRPVPCPTRVESAELQLLAYQASSGQVPSCGRTSAVEDGMRRWEVALALRWLLSSVTPVKLPMRVAGK